MVYKIIKNFKEQLIYNPQVKNSHKSKLTNKFLVVGMGGSHLSADLLKVWNPKIDLIIHKNYNLPPLSLNYLKNRLIILSSYSGNTEEVIQAFYECRSKNLQPAIIASGGKLLNLARKYGCPYIELPNPKIQPRLALGYMTKALLKLMNQNQALKDIENTASLLEINELEKEGQKLAKKLFGFIPIIYSSQNNIPLAYNWKIKFNETSKIPAFCNFFPELNHNEMAGFNKKTFKEINSKFYFLILEDEADDYRIKKRMRIFYNLYTKLGFKVEEIPLKTGENIFYKIFSSVILADWTSYYLANLYRVNPERVIIVEEFKKLINNSF